MKFIKLAAVLGMLLLLSLFLARPYTITTQIQYAVEHKDSQALARHVDLPAVRASLKSQISAMLARQVGNDRGRSPIAALSAVLAPGVIDTVVDAYVTAERLPALIDDAPGVRKGSGARRTAPFIGAQIGYKSPNRFVIITRTDRDSATFVLTRRGLGWKLTEIELPLDRIVSGL